MTDKFAMSKFAFSRFLRSMMRPGAAVVLSAVLLLVCGTARAQLSGEGAISGTVEDTTGAAIPNATIVVKSNRTGVTVTAHSTGAGDYAVSTLSPGTYTIEVTAAGFQKLTQEHVEVNALEPEASGGDDGSDGHGDDGASAAGIERCAAGSDAGERYVLRAADRNGREWSAGSAPRE
jgi:hypothetical protein